MLSKKNPLAGICLALSLLLFFLTPTFPAFALVRRIQESPGVVLIQSRHSLRDSLGNTWQAVLYQRTVNGQLKSVHLRLVGFPEAVTFSHPQPLVITSESGKSWVAPDVFPDNSKAPAPNVGEYDLASLLSFFSPVESLTLSLPNNSSLTIPAAVVVEWQSLSKM